MLDITFGSRELERCFVDSRRAFRSWGPDVARKYLARINQLYEAPTLQDVRMIRPLRLHALKGSREGQLAIMLTAQWRLIVKPGGKANSLEILEVTNHYDD